MNDLRKVPLNTDRILKLAEEAFTESTGSEEEDEDRYSSHYVEPEDNQESSAAPADEPAPEPATPSAPEPIKEPEAESAYKAMWREAMDTNKALLGMVQDKFSSERTPPQMERASAPVADPYQQFEPEHLVMHGDLQPLHNTLREVQTVTRMFEMQVQRQVENEARSAFNEIIKEFPDAAQVIDQNLFEAAVNGAKMQSVNALKQGKEMRVDWRSMLTQEYNAHDAPRLREKMRAEQAKAAQDAELKAKQQAELDKVSGVPSRGAQYQGGGASQKKVEPGGDWRAALRSRVNNVVTRFKAD